MEHKNCSVMIAWWEKHIVPLVSDYGFREWFHTSLIQGPISDLKGSCELKKFTVAWSTARSANEGGRVILWEGAVFLGNCWDVNFFGHLKGTIADVNNFIPFKESLQPAGVGVLVGKSWPVPELAVSSSEENCLWILGQDIIKAIGHHKTLQVFVFSLGSVSGCGKQERVFKNNNPLDSVFYRISNISMCYLWILIRL